MVEKGRSKAHLQILKYLVFSTNYILLRLMSPQSHTKLSLNQYKIVYAIIK